MCAAYKDVAQKALKAAGLDKKESAATVVGQKVGGAVGSQVLFEGPVLIFLGRRPSEVNDRFAESRSCLESSSVGIVLKMFVDVIT